MHLLSLLYYILFVLVVGGEAINNIQLFVSSPGLFDFDLADTGGTDSSNSNSADLAIMSQNLPASTSSPAIITRRAAAPMAANTSMETNIAAAATISGTNLAGKLSSISVSEAVVYTSSSMPSIVKSLEAGTALFKASSAAGGTVGNATGVKMTMGAAHSSTNSKSAFVVPTQILLAAAGMLGLVGMLAAL